MICDGEVSYIKNKGCERRERERGSSKNLVRGEREGSPQIFSG